ncbi:MAG: PAS domain S-box protein [Myxococcales bacterium]|nr:PAS domain S-box protein [Myxococcales bacterium]
MLLVLYGIGLFSLAHRPDNAWTQWYVRSSGLSGALFFAFLLTATWLNIDLGIGHMSIRTVQNGDTVLIGGMSAITAVCFTIFGLALSLFSWRSGAKPKFVILAFGLSCLVMLIGSAFFLAYLFGYPQVYEGRLFPPSMAGALSLALLGLGLSVLSARRIWPIIELDDPEAARTGYRLLAAVALLGIGIISTGYIYYQNYEKRFRHEVELRLTAIAELKTAELTNWYQDRLADGAIFYRNEAFAAIARRVLTDSSDRAAMQQMMKWLTQVGAAYSYTRIFLLDRQGEVLISTPPSKDPVCSELQKGVLNVLQSEQIEILDFHRDSLRQPIHLTVLVPLFDELKPGQPMGALALWIDPSIYLFPFIQRWPTESQSAETLLVRQDGPDVLFLNTLKFDPDAALRRRIPLTETAVPAVMAVRGKSGVVEGTDYRGMPVIAAVMAVPSTPWYLVARIDKAEVFAPLREQLWIVVLLVGILLLAMGSGVGLVWRRQRIRAFWEKYEAAEALHQSEERHRITLMSVGDGVIVTDAEGRVETLNPIAETLSGWTRTEAIGKPVEEVFRLIHEETRETMDSPVRLVLAHGKTVALANHAVLVAKNGAECPIADSGAPIRGADGGLTGVVLVFRDQSAERAARQALRDSETAVRRKLKAILEPEGDLGDLTLSDIIDSESVQSLLEDFFHATNFLVAILDLEGNILVARGWQDICTRFFRIHPQTCINCTESDTILSQGVPAGEFRLYRCKNGMWDLATPIVVQGKHVGNIFFGQFFFDDEIVDREAFRRQAAEYGFNEEEFLAALDRVPRLRRTTVETIMSFYAKLAGLVANLSHGNIRLARALTERERLLQSLRESEQRFRSLFENATNGVAIYEAVWDEHGEPIDFIWLEANATFADYSGRQLSELSGRRITEVFPAARQSPFFNNLIRVARTGEPATIEFFSEIWRRELIVGVFQASRGRFGTIIQDITARKKAENELRRRSAVDAALAELSAQMLASEAPLERIVPQILRQACRLTESEFGFVSAIDPKNNASIGIALATAPDRITSLTDWKSPLTFPWKKDSEAGGLTGYSPTRQKAFYSNAPALLPGGEESPASRPPRNFLAVPAIVEDHLLGQIFLADAKRDYTDEDQEDIRRLAEYLGFSLRDWRTRDKLRQSEEQLRQAQKMEAVGRLAGGIAHDFNNLLTGITGFTDIILAGMEEDDPVRSDLVEVKSAADKAVSLTAQLLAFSRRQVIVPKIIDLNELLTESMKMLQRLIGEDIVSRFNPDSELAPIKIDPQQIDQVLVNLAVNARDAMPNGGVLTIETNDVMIDEEYARDHLEVKPGRYIQLVVSDNGTGMTPNVMEHLFEPFFTTKEKGKGTGLGLSMVYGIVKQNGGFINVYSEPGIGSSFKIYLPKVEGDLDPLSKKPAAELPPRGHETILLVEDEDTVRNLAERVLSQQGYQVISRKDPEEARALIRQDHQQIDLLLTDVVMPKLNGRQLFEAAQAVRADLRVLFMSGYTENAIAHHGVIEKGTNYIPKPFTADHLLRKIREVLEG